MFSTLTKQCLVSFITDQGYADEIERRLFTRAPLNQVQAQAKLGTLKFDDFTMLEIKNRLTWDVGGSGEEGTRLARKINGMIRVVQAVANAAESQGAKASFTGQAAGMTTDVVLEAAVRGVGGNSISLVGDGAKSVNQLIIDWNGLNPLNTVVLVSGIGTQIPDLAASLDLAGGTADSDADLAVAKAIMGSDHVSAADFEILVSALCYREVADEFRRALDAMVDSLQTL